MLGALDRFFLKLEGKPTHRKAKRNSTKQTENVPLNGTFSRILFAKDKGLDGWKDDREGFKTELVNDIKTFLFGKWENPVHQSMFFSSTGKALPGFCNIAGKPYTSLNNRVILEENAGNSPFFLTVESVLKQGGTILNKEKVCRIISFIPIVKSDKKLGDIKTVPFDFLLPKPIKVINAAYCKDVKVPAFTASEFSELELSEYVENVIKAIKKKLPPIYYDGKTVNYYIPAKDEIHMCPTKLFKSTAHYYSTLFHEIMHSTKKEKRTGRDKNKLNYATEELVAEMGAMVFCSALGLNYERNNSISYLKNWLDKAVKKSQRSVDEILVEAYDHACEAADFLLKDVDIEKLVPKMDSEEKKPEEVKEKQTEEKLQSEFHLPRAKPDDINKDLAYRSHLNVSFSPEKRAISVREQYAASINEFADQLEKIAKTEEQQIIALNEFSVYVEKAKSKYSSWLQAMSRCLSSMITGPSKFPVRRAEKANKAEHARYQEYYDYCVKAEKRIIKLVQNADKATLANEIDKDNKKIIIEELATITGIVKGELHYTKSLIVDGMFRKLNKMPKEAKIFAINTALDIQKKQKITLFAKNHRFWKMVDETTEVVEETINKEREIIFSSPNVEIINNYIAERVQISTKEKPSQEAISWLKKHAFKWSPSQKVWQRVNTRAGIYEAEDYVKKFFPEEVNENELTSIVEAVKEVYPAADIFVSDPKKSSKVVVSEKSVKEIFTDEKRFQNRKNAFSEDSKNRIIKAVENGSFDWAKFDPILIWFDTKAQKYFVLSGHSRLAAFRELAKTRIDFANIPCRVFEGSESAAIEAALNSNTLSTKETDVERAAYYYKSRQTCELQRGLGAKNDCEKMVEEQCREREGKNAPFILNLSYLAPDGVLMEMMHNIGADKDNDSTNILRTVANWTGEARRSWSQLTDAHENEIARFLLNGGYGSKKGQFKKKTDFMERLRVVLAKWNGKAETPLNIAGSISVSSFEHEWQKRLSEAQERLNDATRDYDEKHKKYLAAQFEGKINENKRIELEKPLIDYVLKCKKEVVDIQKQQGLVRDAEKQQTSLFGIDDINKQFNAELQLLIEGKLPKGHVFNLGDTNGALLCAGLPPLPLQLSANRLLNKSKQSNHVFDLKALMNLPSSVNNPIAVFKSKTVEGSFVVLIDQVFNNKNFVIAIEVNKEVVKWGNGTIIINSARSIYPKDTYVDVLNWIAKENLLLWVEKEKAFDLLVRWRSNYANATQLIKSCTKIIQNFENPQTDIYLDGLPNTSFFGFNKIGSASRKTKILKLKGDIGKFLGGYERCKYSIVLRGDKGAGKSRLLFQMVNAFASETLKCAIISLEMSPNSSVIKNYTQYIEKQNKKNIEITDYKFTYDELSQVCKQFAVVAIDSWTKLKGMNQDDFDRLQNDNPETILLTIFQSTTGKVTRGGNMPEFDASTVIHVHEGGIAVAEKNRYGSTDCKYLVFEQKIKKEDE